MSAKVVQFDLFLKTKEDVERAVKEAKRRNFSRRINHLFGELERLKAEISEFDASELIEKAP